MKLEISIASGPDDFPGVVALIEVVDEHSVHSIADILPMADGTHKIVIWPQAGNEPVRVGLEEFQAAVADAVVRLATYDGGPYAELPPTA